jgi:glucose-1-phosphate adenylyltransferase
MLYQGYRVIAFQLAAGDGARLWPLVASGLQSKATLRFLGKRLAYYTIDRVEDADIKNLIVAVKYDDIEVRKKLRIGEHYKGFDSVSFVMPKEEFFHPDEPLRFRGTADAVWQNADALKGFEYAVVVPCDHVTNVDLGALVERAIFNHEKYGAVITTAAMEKPLDEIKLKLGNPQLGQNGRVVNWKEKPETPISNLAALGIYAGPVGPMLKAIERSGNDFGRNVLKQLREEGLLYCHYYPGHEYYWNDVGTRELLLQAARDYREGRIKNVKVPFHLVNMKTRAGGIIENSAVSTEDRQPEVYGVIRNSVLGYNTMIDQGVLVTGSIFVGDNSAKATQEKPIKMKLEIGGVTDAVNGIRTVIEDAIIGRRTHVSNTDLHNVDVGRSAMLQRCTIKPGIGIRPDAQLYDENITSDYQREDG